MSQPFIGEIQILPYTFAPEYWAWCNGQTVPISQNQALYAVIGITFGGNGRTNMGLPNLRGRAPVGWGQAPGLSYYAMGQLSGYPQVTLVESNLPSHDHTAKAAMVTGVDNQPTSDTFLGITVSGSLGAGIRGYHAPDAAAVQMADQALAPAGKSIAHENRQPFLGLHFCIALEGLFPSRN